MSSLAELRDTRLSGWAAEAWEKLHETARASLDSQDLVSVRLGAAAGGLVGRLDAEENQVAGETEPIDQLLPIVQRKIRVKDEEFEMTLLVSLGRYDEKGIDALLAQLRQNESPAVRSACAGELRRFAHRRKLRDGLLDALEGEKEPSVRADVAAALSRATKSTRVRSRLLEALDADPDAEVREACARALRSAAVRDKNIRDRLISVVRSDLPAAVRAGAARGLSRCATKDREVQDLLLIALRDVEEQDAVRTACLWALEGVLPSLPSQLEFACGLLSGNPQSGLTRVAAQILAQYAAAGTAKWDELPIGQIERVLMSLEDPCVHALDALRAVANARELRRLGIPREARIRQALREFEDRIRAMFVFGSSARGEQDAESDIDLMVIGDVSLKELAPGLRRAEQELGRQVSVVIHSPEQWAKRCRERDPFVTAVLKNKKLFALGDPDELAAMGG
ncbi:MAG TPA: HEAT repeat domain-containing protein [Phycisphaerae bacterium]|nr:HEAT repeat domain-containing protein [Phycisphaerae bacterium]